MSIPLDRLYNFIDGLCNQDTLIYRWFPHGSKKLEDLQPLKQLLHNGQLPFEKILIPQMICHDQEPLDYSIFLPEKILDSLKNIYSPVGTYNDDPVWWNARINFESDLHLSAKEFLNIHDTALLVHSEKNSQEVNKFKKLGFVPVYYWSHALIAQDWFRYARHLPTLNKKNIEKDFLIYNRAWAGTREYRLKFAELITKHNLHNSCAMSFCPIDHNYHYRDHEFANKKFAVGVTDLELYFPENNYPSGASADFVIEDYAKTGIEVVLETLFDDTRNHLTEKTLRPIACRQPFILAATPNSLEYLKDYGFKTFNSLWDESYDKINNPIDRLNAIINLMNQLAALPDSKKQSIYNSAKTICEFNHQRFFSDEFFNSVVNEFKQNFEIGLSLVLNGSKGNKIKQKLDLFEKYNRKMYPFIISYETYQQLKNLKF